MQSEVQPGQIVAERYLVETLLGQGGMGAVFRARTLSDRQSVALKVVLPGPARLRLVSRFMREARLSSRLHHPHVVRVLDYGRWGEAREHGYLTMELVEGVSLEGLLDAGLSAAAACELVRQLLTALAHVHARGVLHRDIKPDNVLVTRRDDGLLVARLTDFGLAWALSGDDDEETTKLTQDGSILGTPAYMAPEQASGHAGLGPATDLYALGVMLYRMLSGRLPFTGAPMQMLLARLHGPPAPLTPRPGTELPPMLTAVVDKLLARHPEERFALAADVLTELAPFAGPEPFALEDWLALTGAAPGSFESDKTELDLGSALFEAGSRHTLLAEPGRVAALESQQLWGRERELGELEALAGRAEAGAGQLVLLMGAVGVGKSALAERMAVSLNEVGRFRVLRARATPGSGGALGAVRAALDVLLDTHGRPAAVVERAVRSLLAQHGDEDAVEVAELMALLRPEAAPEQALDTRQALAAFLRMLRRLSRVRPVLVVLDDLEHDAETAALIELVVFELTLDPLPLLMLVPLRQARSELAVRDALSRTARAEGRVRRSLDVGPLEREVLAEGLEGALGLSPRVAEHVARRAGGNPLFAQHLAASLADASSTELGTLSTWSTSSTSSDGLPEVLRSLLEASLSESLARTSEPERARGLLEHLAVLGEHVEVALLEAFFEGEARRWLDDDLDALIDTGVLVDAGPEAVAFANGLLAPVVLAGLGPRRLRRMHARAAEMRRAHCDGRAIGQIGDHLVAAGDSDGAVAAWLQALARAERLGSTTETARWGHKALAVLEADDARRGPCALAVGRALRGEADFSGAMAVLEPLRAAADADLALQAGEIIAEIEQERLEFDAWEATLAALDARFDAAGPVGRAAALRARAFFLNTERRFDEARACAHAALELCSDDAVAGISVLARLVWSSISLGQLTEARELAELAIELAAERLDLQGEALRLRMIVHSHSGEPEALLEVGQRMLEAHRRVGRVARRVVGGVDLALGLMLNMRPAEARHWLAPTVAVAERFGLHMELVRARLIETGCALLDGDVAQAMRVIDEPLMQAALKRGVPLFLTVHAWALALAGRSDEALAVLARFDPENEPGSRLIAMTYEQLGRLLLEPAPDTARRLLTAARTRWLNLGNHAVAEQLAQIVSSEV